MANTCENVIAVIGLQEASEVFIRKFSIAAFGIDLDNLSPGDWGENATIDGTTWYGSLVEEYRRKGATNYYILYPSEPYTRMGTTTPCYYVETKWSTPIDELRKASQAFPSLTFHVAWWVGQDGPSGEYVVCNGEMLENIERRRSWYLFDPITHPIVSLLSAHLPLSLTQHAAARLEDAIDLVRGLKAVLDGERFLHSPYTPFSDVRDQVKTANVRAGLTSLLDSMATQVKQIDFSGVLLEEEELQHGLTALATKTARLMSDLEIDCLAPDPGEAVRFAILPGAVAILSDPFRAIVPVLHYTNALRETGRYARNADGSVPPSEWAVRYVCLLECQLSQIKRLPDDGQSPCDIDLVMTHAEGRPFQYEFNRASKTARWKQTPEVAKRVEKAAVEAANVFAARLASKAGINIVDGVSSWIDGTTKKDDRVTS
jgi:hypothetical protein